ncbi:MAG: [acyl-carrier-protein] S-malonyltransferase [Pyrinomonadaceae bacterium]|jgi:[acyl-carrier-protein] S-malonyltransferase|nr:[acyl-carrier-protein] S-malonyltransferase [Pyrinomonadaceae bacterium]
MTIAYIFPGQGSQYPGMGKNLVENFAVARRIFEEADDALHFSISRLCFEGSVEELQLTENTQPAILAVSVAVLGVIESEGFPKPKYVAGHSLGEYSALVAAKSLSLSAAIQTVRRRGRYMQEAVPPGVGAMAAVMGLELKAIETACEEAQQGEVCAPANINSPNQVVIAGNAEAVERAVELLKNAGAKRVVKLNVSAPFHCALMLPAQERLAFDLESVSFQDLSIPLVTNVDAATNKAANAARDAVVRQVSAPVRWLESMQLLIEQGVENFVEVGPGKVLSGLMRQISREVKCFNVEDAASLKAASAGLGVS